jgi:hypothetical protein
LEGSLAAAAAGFFAAAAAGLGSAAIEFARTTTCAGSSFSSSPSKSKKFFVAMAGRLGFLIRAPSKRQDTKIPSGVGRSLVLTSPLQRRLCNSNPRMAPGSGAHSHEESGWRARELGGERESVKEKERGWACEAKEGLGL